jgi:alanyl-tRNA synthetase
MQYQKMRARQAWKGSGDEKIKEVYKRIVQEGIRVIFKGYEKNNIKSHIQKIIKKGEPVECACSGEEIEIITTDTPFYGEAGGQVGDTGLISGKNFIVEVTDTLKPLADLTVHRGKITQGQIRVGEECVLYVDKEKRQSTANNHTATHILQSVLRAHLGNHVKQAGSLVTPDRLRFDFTHFEALTKKELNIIENQVNKRIREDIPLEVHMLPQQEAIAMGATALFGEKYEEVVRVVSISDYSMELCGGNHAGSTGEIGIFKIINEGAVAAGVRRIEALTGKQAFRFIQEEEEILARLSNMLKTEPGGVLKKIERLLSAQKNLEKEVEKLKSQLITKQATSIFDQVKEVAGIKVLISRINEKDPKSLRDYGDKIRDRLGSGIIVFGAESGGKAQLLSMVTKDITDRFSAGRIIQEIAPIVGGRGGGREDMAQAGGKKPESIEEALEKALNVIEKYAKNS